MCWARWEIVFVWQNCGRASPRLEASHPAVQEVSGREMRLLSREVVERLRNLERRRAWEVEENRARKAVRELLD